MTFLLVTFAKLAPIVIGLLIWLLVFLFLAMVIGRVIKHRNGKD